jgi:hypothetical protein
LGSEALRRLKAPPVEAGEPERGVFYYTPLIIFSKGRPVERLKAAFPLGVGV